MRLFRTLTKIVVFVALIAVAVYWFRFAPVAVLSHEVTKGDLVSEAMGTGTLEARVSATISPKISGRIEALNADQGDLVKVGDLLVQLDDAELQQQVEIAEANVNAASAAVTRLSSDKERSEAVYEQARRNNARLQQLTRQNAASPEEADKATEGLAVAEAGIGSAEAAIAEGQKELVAAEKTLQYHRARLQDTKIVAPFDGLVIRRNREPGDIAVPGSSILTLISMDEVWISAWVDETEMARLKTDQPARIVFRSQPYESFPGSVARLGREADRETREFLVDVRVHELPTNWAVGQRAEAFIRVEQVSNAVTLPARLVQRRNGAEGVFVLSGGHAKWQPVKLGLRSRDAVEVTDGLSAGDVVIRPAKPGAILRDDQTVTVRLETEI
ncbi:efflux RND transporter periplasmic adaptor subunit [Rubripirellula reticaptiva]|uniref:Macrolide export protein MacA n=1 Tax=Rubripirellula reticaptiva TaxID=2528013 RepID=A0A5C6EIG0_9BACT|nr:efflux RND transporter periplasmic adaptor subunit [Rubripirellula reticaptiva]TWU47049.1 Macrolide export protein MacA [Rubripirellula reticaptiva]